MEHLEGGALVGAAAAGGGVVAALGEGEEEGG